MNELYPVPEQFATTARTNLEEYEARYQQSIDDPEGFWAEQAKIIDWIKPFTKVKDTNFDRDNFKIEWFADGELNVAANCLDRHLKEHPHKPAIIWEGDHPNGDRSCCSDACLRTYWCGALCSIRWLLT